MDVHNKSDEVQWLDAVGRADLPLVGGKGANLGELLRAGLPVPPGFVVTTAVYRSLVDAPAVREALSRLERLDADESAALAAAAAELRSAIRAQELAASARDGLSAALDAVDPGETYAVRSSATAEDSPTASFAGQHETFLGVDAADVPDCVRECMASLFTDRAVSYRAHDDVAHSDVAMAVVVQPMVEAEAGGVLFTADAETGNRRVSTVDASFGLGEAVVGGDVTPDHARVDTETGEILAYDVATKDVAVRSRGIADDADETTGVETVELSARERERRVLSDEQLRTLVGLGERVQTLFGTPQDVEWALVDGAFVLLQSRPITALFPLPSPLPDDDRLHVYLSMGHMQAMPEALPPLVCDFWRDWVDSAMAAFGVATVWPTPAIEAGSRVYVDVTPFVRSDTVRDELIDGLAAISEPASTGLDDLTARRSEAFESAGLSLSALPKLVRPAWQVSTLVVAVIPGIASGVVQAFTSEPTKQDLEETWRELSKTFTAEVARAETPAERARAVFSSTDVTGIVTEMYPKVAPLYVAFAIGGWLKRAFPETQADVNAVGSGFERDVVTRINLGLGDLADVAREHPAVAEALRERRSLDGIRTVDGGDVFVAAVESFLDEFGHRATGELDLSRPRWREDPSGLLAIVRANLAHEEAGDHRERIRRLAAEGEVAATRLERRADHGPLGPLRSRLVRLLVQTYRNTVYTREYPKHEAARAFTTWRQALLDAGRHLVDAGRLDDPEDVWFLHADELFAALDGESVDVDVAARRREFDRHTTLDAPPVLTSEGETIRGRFDRTDVPDGALVGTGVSAGVVEGRARVVRDPTEATVEPGEILVAPSSDPGWTPLFLNAAGMVVEVGGPVSHGALVAREYGLPAVVSVHGATKRIQTGQRLRIDGSRGTVEILDD
ncbi:pyruvate, water dikinase [Halogranum amylolyticum]|uniref:Pyruvate, water dikinase n=1 Tax=Halogranum amylolyticum TaxID=660520 RepID=A0A1H8PSV9_9EURY|nr:PEP/pyruvate-binding domain-containing protein [Halogranum amylolyticum]SEO44798.1 pyruvate, water dikinase [Halogranum amylolyticum]